MAHVEGAIPNFINGISQQATPMRLPSQGESSENYIPTVTDGLIQRPPSEHLASLVDLPANAFTHFILRDEDEKYVVAIMDTGVIRVWDFAGTEKTVHDTSTGAYLAGLTNPFKQLKAFTMADYTFVTNKSKEVTVGATYEATRPYEALVNVMSGNYGKAYRIFIDGVEQSSLLTPNGGDASHTAYIDTAFIAENLRGGLISVIGDGPVGGGGGGSIGSASTTFVAPSASASYDTYGTGNLSASPWAVGRYNHVVHIQNTSVDFVTTVEDGYSGKAMVAVQHGIQKFSDLPTFGPDGFVIKVSGDKGAVADDYWVKFTKENSISSAGIWKECARPGTRLGFEANTAPHVLVRESDGTFTFRAAEWDGRSIGDEETVPDPSFVTQKVEDIFLFKNRLGLLTRENTVLSRSGSYFSFYRATLTAFLDTDPIDTAASHIKVSYLRHAVPFQRELVVFSDRTQFVLKGNDLLTPKTVNNTPVSEISSIPTIRPVATATTLFFPGERGRYAGLYEYYLDKTLETADYTEVTSHVPAYVPSGCRQLECAPDLNMAFLTTDGDPSALYLYKYFYNGQEKLQSAWCHWRIPGASQVINMAFDGVHLRALVRRGSMVYLESLNCGPGVVDDLGFRIRLDRRVTVVGGSYESATNRTTFTLPFAPPANLKIISANGFELPVVATSGNTASVSGNMATATVTCGVPYEARFRLSTIHARDPKDGKTSRLDGRLAVRTLILEYSKSSRFQVEVTPEGRPQRTYPFSSNSPDSGHLAVPVHSRSDRVVIDIVTNSWRPCAFLSAKWRGTFNPYKRQG